MKLILNFPLTENIYQSNLIPCLPLDVAAVKRDNLSLEVPKTDSSLCNLDSKSATLVV